MKNKLIDFNPSFLGTGGDGVTRNGKPVSRREGVGLSFDCPCGCGCRAFIYFENPLDGGFIIPEHQPNWKRTGDTFETLTLFPSLQRNSDCKWHGFLTDGVFKEC